MEQTSHMNFVASHFNLKLEEEFSVRNIKTGLIRECKYKFTKDYLMVKINNDNWEPSAIALESLLNGACEIVFIPRDGQTYFSYSGKDWEITSFDYSNTVSDILRINNGIAFKTFKEADDARYDCCRKFTGKYPHAED